MTQIPLNTFSISAIFFAIFNNNVDWMILIFPPISHSDVTDCFRRINNRHNSLFHISQMLYCLTRSRYFSSLFLYFNFTLWLMTTIASTPYLIFASVTITVYTNLAKMICLNFKVTKTFFFLFSLENILVYTVVLHMPYY